MSKQILLIIVVIAVVVGGGAFYGGMKYGQSTGSPSLNRQNFQANMQQLGTGTMGQRGGTQSGVGFTGGEIISKDDKSITIKLKDGGSKIVFFSDATEIMKSIEGLVGDLTVGEQVQINGTANQDGSITAQSIQLGSGMQRAPQ